MKKALVNGIESDLLTVHDRGFLYGDGLFETLAVRDGRPLAWSAHMERLARGCAALGIAMPPEAVLARESAQLCRAEKQAVLRIMVSRGSGGRGYAPPADAQPTRVVSVYDWPAYPRTCWSEGVSVALCETRLARQPRLAGLKHLNRLEQVLARAELYGLDAAEGLVFDTAGNVIEGTMSNVFLIRGGELLTPQLGFCGVAGIVRALVLERAASFALTASERDLTLGDVHAAEEVFFTNSVIGIWPARRVGSRDIPSMTRGLGIARSLAEQNWFIVP